MRQTTCNWIKKILDEATRIVNVFLISGFFYLFLLCSISLLVKYAFILRYEAWVNIQERLVSLKTFPKSAQNQSLSSEICSGGSHEIGRSLPIVFQQNWPQKFPRNRSFFPRICPWKSREIWLFFPRPTRSPGLGCCAGFFHWTSIGSNSLFFYSMPGPRSMIARQSMSGCEVQQREIKMLVRKVSRVNWCFWLSQSLKFNFFLFLSGLYFIWQVYTASPIFGVEFETEEKVNTKLLI